MPVHYRIDESHSVVRLDVSDPLDIEQILNTVRGLLADPRLCPGLNIISNHSALDASATIGMVKLIPTFLKELGERLGSFDCAIVVSGDLSFGMARMTEVFADDGPARVRGFRSLDEAEEWLGI